MYVKVDVADIAEYPHGFPQFWLNSLFVTSVSSNHQIVALAKTYVRLVEAALVEYRLGAEKLREFWATHNSFNLGAAHRAVSHFESCLSDMYRATNCFRRLRRHPDEDSLSVALNEEKASFATDAVADRFRLMRHEIHHLEELVMDGRLQEGQPFALKPDGPETAHPTEADQTIKAIDRLVIGQREILFSELATWLSEMGRFAQKIAEFGSTSSATPGPPAAA